MQARARQAAAPIFALTLFFSAALIFILQPMFARMTTPLLGGSPAVWNTSMVFFQGALLIGYAYAHLLARLKDTRRQVFIHGLVLAAGCIVLPISVTMAFGEANPASPVLWLFGVLALSVGLPYAAASATAPLLQAWFARTGRDDAGDPYYLYAASNLGSLIGLIAYPIALEPLLGLSDQRTGWSIGYVVLIGLVVLCGMTALWSKGGPLSGALDGASETTPVATPPATSLERWKERGMWMAAAAVPSSLLLGVTTHISTDVASAPFLWVVPLSLYLLTFVIAFARNTQFLREPAGVVLPIALAGLVFTFATYVGFGITLSAHLGVFFIAALVCHFALAQARPEAARLTEFYMYVSTGGVIGGALTALVAPVIFNDVFEYPLALAAAALFLPRNPAPLPRWGALALVGLAGLAASISMVLGMDASSDEGATLTQQEIYQSIGIAALAGFAIAGSFFQRLAMALAIASIGVLLLLTYFFFIQRDVGPTVPLLALGVTGAAIFANRSQPVLVAALVLVAFAMIRLDRAAAANVVFQERSFFGVTRVLRHEIPDGTVRVMVHGTTTHGAQYESGPRITEPLTYYNPKTGLGHATVRAIAQFESAHIGLIGLGAGSSACTKRPQDRVTIYEIDPKVVRMSTQMGIFTYVPRCAPDAKIFTGDGRLGVRAEPDASLDVLVVDAFSSDAVPAHLLTREALREYMKKLSPKGVAILHLSNRNLDLVGEASRVAREEGLGALYTNSSGGGDTTGWDYTAYPTTVMVVGHTQAAVEALQLGDEWLPAEQLEGRAWSDEYVNFIRPLTVKLFGG